MSESTVAANAADLSALRLRQRVLRDVSQLQLSTTVLGQDLALPVVLAPVGLAGMFARRGEVQAARAAEAAGVAFCESTVSICGVEEVAGATTRPPWFQLYVMHDRGYAEELLARATAVASPVLLLTVDLPAVGSRYRDVRNGLSGTVDTWGKVVRGLDRAAHPTWALDVGLQGRPHTFGNLEQAVPGASSPVAFQDWVDSQFDPGVTWDALDWVREHWTGRLVLKGVLDVEDARRAADAGVDGIVVSNHGGRQLDGAPSTIRALGPVVDAVGERLEVLVDGGVRSGTDLVRALAVGASACLVGRPWAWAVAARGQAGVTRMLATLGDELRVALSLVGVDDVGALDRGVLVDD